LPELCFWFSVGWIGGCCVPLPLADSHAQKTSDYHVVFAAAYSDHYFTDHEQATWDALGRVYKRQADFLSWNYVFLLFETTAFILLTRYYGYLRRFKLYAPFASRVLLPAVSEWHILLTDFTFPRREKRSVKADIMSKDDILYRGDSPSTSSTQAENSSGLLIKNPERFQYEKLKDDRKDGVPEDTDEYWKAIPGGGNFYLPNSNIASINIRYELPEPAFEQVVLDALKRLNIGTLSKVNVQRIRRERT
jgi:hypothetical protein